MSTISTKDPEQTRMELSALSGEENLSEIVIRPRRGWIGIDWAELLRYRELLYFLVWRDVSCQRCQKQVGTLLSFMLGRGYELGRLRSEGVLGAKSAGLTNADRWDPPLRIVGILL